MMHDYSATLPNNAAGVKAVTSPRRMGLDD
ncbi:hypothetical protein EV644_11254 [Kribbella orskensis]|uniref:Uncharacterized protein n=1 Tax=Kribbella orskensis TaxID=2512216 RepID=A0ABY2BEW6_9ACTN|nr:hypothetical protein EV642_11354 [Kribbella sp. VKM Ac-2500]TCO18306.1 hypothetical protein EV644_11254 [Kribbella orskensis]